MSATISVPPEEAACENMIAEPAAVSMIAYTSSRKGWLVRGSVIGAIFSRTIDIPENIKLQ